MEGQPSSTYALRLLDTLQTYACLLSVVCVYVSYEGTSGVPNTFFWLHETFRVSPTSRSDALPTVDSARVPYFVLHTTSFRLCWTLLDLIPPTQKQCQEHAIRRERSQTNHYLLYRTGSKQKIAKISHSGSDSRTGRDARETGSSVIASDW